MLLSAFFLKFEPIKDWCIGSIVRMDETQGFLNFCTTNGKGSPIADCLVDCLKCLNFISYPANSSGLVWVAEFSSC